MAEGSGVGTRAAAAGGGAPDGAGLPLRKDMKLALRKRSGKRGGGEVRGGWGGGGMGQGEGHHRGLTHAHVRHRTRE
jgi:hypothetical protein